MAQIQPARGGLQWVKSLSNPGLGTPPIVEKLVMTTNTYKLMKGDLLSATVDGAVYPTVAGATSAFVMDSAANYLGSDGLPRKGQYVPASTTYTGTASLSNPLATKVLAIPVQGQVFAAIIPTAAATLTAATALIGQCADIFGHPDGKTGDTTSGYSTEVVDTTSTGWQSTTTSAQLLLVEIPKYGLNGTPNDPTAANWLGYFVVNEIQVAI